MPNSNNLNIITPLLKSFIEQTHNSIENAQKQDSVANQKDQILKDWDLQRFQQAYSLMSRDQSISSYTNVPTQLQPNELNQIPVIHPNMNYDHSDTLDRLPQLRENYLNEKYKDNPENKPMFDNNDWGELDQDGDLPIIDL